MDVVAANSEFRTPLSNSILLPLVLLSVARQRHTPEPSKKFTTEYDYVIVGAGSAGSVLASRLTELPCVSVLLLEAGAKPPLITEVPGVGRWLRGTRIDWRYKTVPQKHTGFGMVNRQVPWPSGKCLGGSSVLNSLLYVRGNRKVYDQWEEEGAKGWNYKELLPYLKKMENNRDPEYLANGYHGKNGPLSVQRPRYQSEVKAPIFKAAKAIGYEIVDPNDGRQTGYYDFQATLRNGQRCSNAKAYLVPAENRTNLDIIANAMVHKVLIKNGRAEGVLFDYEGHTYTVMAKREVILSAGATNTPQILMLSGIGPREELQKFNIPVHADLPGVGKNLQDTVAGYTYFLVDHLPKSSDKLSDRRNILQYVEKRSGPLTAADFDSALAFLKNNAIDPKVDFPDHELVFAEAQGDLFVPLGLTQKVLEQVFGPYENDAFLLCGSLQLHPRSRGTITLKSKNPYDPPVIDPNYLEHPQDVKDIVEGLKDCMRIGTHPIMKKAGLSPFETLVPGCEKYAKDMDSYFECVVRSYVVTFSNYVGTARMGDPRDSHTVVDPNLRVLKIKGLRVIDASVIPLIPNGNTNAATMAIAERASDIIKSTIDCHMGYGEPWKNSDSDGWSEESYPSNHDQYQDSTYPLEKDTDHHFQDDGHFSLSKKYLPKEVSQGSYPDLDNYGFPGSYGTSDKKYWNV